MSESEVTKGGTLLEGDGVFKDYNGSKDGKPVFETKSVEEWEAHCKEAKLTTSGTAPCAICSTATVFENLAYGKKPLCEKCRSELE
jgi:hypothetical protein